METMDGPDLLMKKMVPFDHFAVWMHYYCLGFPFEPLPSDKVSKK